MGTAILILLLLALCGFIAYLGDLLGRRLGKKRLSVFGLRPKHTAILLTVVTGVVIAAVTFGMAMLSVPGFRRVVIQGERLAAQNARLRSSNSQLDTEIRHRTEQNAQLLTRNGELGRANAKFITENGKLQASNRKLETDNRVLTRQNQELGRSNETLTGQNADLRSANSGLKSRNAVLVQKSNQMLAMNARLRSERDAIRGDRERLNRQVNQLRGEVTNLATAAGNYRKDRDRLSREVNKLQGDIENLAEVANNYRQEQYRFRRGQLIENSSQMLPPNPPRDVLRRSIDKAVFEAITTVQRQASSESIVWVKPDGYPPSRSQSLTAISDWVAAQAARQIDKPLAVQVVALENCVEGRAIPLRIDWYVNERVFKQDEVIATSGLIDGAGDEGDILGELINFLKVKVGPTAAEHMATGADSVGELSYKQLLPVCRKIKAAGSFVVVAAVAKQNTLRSGPLNIYLDVRSPSATAGNFR